MAAEKYDDVLVPFLTLMRRELHANSGKGDRPGWLAVSPNELLLEVYYHVAKLQKAVRNNDGPGITEYSADVANMAMMVLDACGGLAWVEVPYGVPTVDPTKPPPSALHSTILDALMHHHMQHTLEDETSGLPLVDMLTPRGDTDIARGKEELELLADAIFDAVEPFGALGVRASDQPKGENHG